jgi:hypothetical protein
MLRDWKIIGITTLAACAYGTAHDQITVRICAEYFTVAHPPIFRVESIPLLALYWGLAATAPFGLAFGLILARVSTSGPAPVTPIPHLIRAILKLLALMAFTAALSGGCAYWLTQHRWISLPQSFAQTIDDCTSERFMATWLAHGASYAVGTFGGAALCWRIWRQRGSPPALAFFPKSSAAILRTLIILTAAAIVFYLRFARH